jgi:glutamate N-acetyltransferase/amino-acid N-acetyltransferase
MAVNLSAPNKAELLPIAGVKLAAVNAGIKQTIRADMVLIALDQGSRVSGVYTKNAFCAAPVIIAKGHQQ